jgi:hypothetical protein
VHELLTQFLTHLFRTVYELWVAPADQALTLMGGLGVQVVYLVVVYLIVRWMWRKLWK